MGMRYSAAAVDPATFEELMIDPDPSRLQNLLDEGIDLDKMWQAAQLVIAGSFLEVQEPLLTGSPLGEDIVYGPAIAASPADVDRVAVTLEDLTEEELVSRYSTELMMAEMAYPGVWTEEPAEDLAAEVAHAAWKLAQLYRHAATGHKAIVAAIR